MESIPYSSSGRSESIFEQSISSTEAILTSSHSRISDALRETGAWCLGTSAGTASVTAGCSASGANREEVAVWVGFRVLKRRLNPLRSQQSLHLGVQRPPPFSMPLGRVLHGP
jgi:hypothetical protein